MRITCSEGASAQRWRVVRALLLGVGMKPLLVALLPFASFACFDHDGSGKVVTEHRQAELFEEVEISGAIDVVIDIADEPTVVVETDDNLQKYVSTQVRGKRLVIKETESLDPSRLIVHVTTPKLVAFDSSGSTHAKISGLDEKRFALDVSGAAEVELQGDVDVFVIDASGAAEIDAEKLIADRVEVDGSGAAEFRVHANETLIADISGAGELEYSGDPETVKTDLSGAASVEKK